MGLPPGPLIVGTDPASSICAVGRQLALRLDKLIHLMSQAEEEPEILLPGGGISAAISFATLAELLSLSLASCPRDHQSIPVDTSATKLVENVTDGHVPVLVTNLDNAQDLHWGAATVLVTAGPIIPARTSHKVLVPPNSALYGVVGAASITVAISTLIVPRI